MGRDSSQGRRHAYPGGTSWGACPRAGLTTGGRPPIPVGSPTSVPTVRVGAVGAQICRDRASGRSGPVDSFAPTPDDGSRSPSPHMAAPIPPRTIDPSRREPSMHPTWQDSIYLQREQLARILHQPMALLAGRCLAVWGDTEGLNRVLAEGSPRSHTAPSCIAWGPMGYRSPITSGPGVWSRGTAGATARIAPTCASPCRSGDSCSPMPTSAWVRSDPR